MRKSIIETQSTSASQSAQREWLPLEQIASVEVTSESPDFPVEKIFSGEPGGGWRAAGPGEQTLRLIFDHPTAIHHIHLGFNEIEVERTHEFCLRWTGQDGHTREIVRQQWSFSPHGSTAETEDYTTDLADVRSLELTIKPDLSPERAVATMASWRVA